MMSRVSTQTTIIRSTMNSIGSLRETCLRRERIAPLMAASYLFASNEARTAGDHELVHHNS